MSSAPSLTLKMLQKRLNDGELDLSSLRLETVPIELIYRCVNFGGETRQITDMNLSNNLLTELPQQFCAFFSELQVLNLSNNKIKSLPEDFGSLSSLYHLNLSNNRIRKLPASFGDLDILKWLNLANNPLDRDLAEITGRCLNDKQCSEAAVSAVQYVGFSFAHSAESTAIIGDDSSSIAPTNESSSNNSSPDFKENPQFEQIQKRKKYRRMPTLSKSEKKLIEKQTTEEEIDSYFYGKFAIVFFFAFLIALGTSLWLTIDSMRVNCLNEDLSKNITNINTLEEQQQYRFCLIINQILTEGEPPNFWKQFLEDFYFTFKNHWGRNVNDKIIEKINSLNLCCWTNILIKWIKIIYSVVWQLILQPLFTFFADYFVHIWELYVLPIIQKKKMEKELRVSGSGYSFTFKAFC